MKKISKEDMQFLTHLSKEMNTQSKRGTRYPLFVIQVDTRDYGDSAWCDETERKNVDDSDGMCDNCLEQYQNDGSGDLPDWCENCNEDCFVWYKNSTDFAMNAGVFFTAEACEIHIAQNRYHYNNPQSYAISAWRNPEMERVMDIISGLTTDDKNLLK